MTDADIRQNPNEEHETRDGLPTRRALITGMLSLTVAGCAGSAREFQTAGSAPRSSARRLYAARPAEPYPIPAVDVSQIHPRYYRQAVDYPSRERPGTVIVDTQERFLYVVQAGGTAMRYGIGIGRQGFSWNGRARVGDKQEWPKWFPPKEMREREPELEKYANGMEPGLQNPLGARAIYLYEGRKDTLYRLHGTMEVHSIGRAVSSGCIRLLNQDVIDLYERVPLEATVVVV